MHKVTTRIIATACLFVAAYATADSLQLAVNEWPETKHQVTVTTEKLGHYRAIADRIGLDYDREYGYTQWVEAKRANNLGEAGEYEPLACSTSDDPWGCYSDGTGFWQSMYYRNVDVTVIYRVHNYVSESSVKLLKLANGRVQDLHRR